VPPPPRRLLLILRVKKKKEKTPKKNCPGALSACGSKAGFINTWILSPLIPQRRAHAASHTRRPQVLRKARPTYLTSAFNAIHRSGGVRGKGTGSRGSYVQKVAPLCCASAKPFFPTPPFRAHRTGGGHGNRGVRPRLPHTRRNRYGRPRVQGSGFRARVPGVKHRHPDEFKLVLGAFSSHTRRVSEKKKRNDPTLSVTSPCGGRRGAELPISRIVGCTTGSGELS
jgi:hypothetical protein